MAYIVDSLHLLDLPPPRRAIRFRERAVQLVRSLEKHSSGRSFGGLAKLDGDTLSTCKKNVEALQGYACLASYSPIALRDPGNTRAEVTPPAIESSYASSLV